VTYVLPSNILTLLNAFDLPEDNITSSNYEAAFNHLNSTYPDTVLGLDIKTCDIQTLLSQVAILIYIYQMTKLFNLFLFTALILTCAGSGGNRSGLHCVHRSNHQDARLSFLVCSLLRHASLLGTLNSVWQH